MKKDLFIQHQQEGRMVDLGQTRAFVYEKGEGVPVLCFHGVPSSSFLYRKVIDQLSPKGFRGISFDFLGMGLSERPEDADYSWTGLGNWCYDLIQKLDIGKFHVVLHDIGGPVGCEVIAKMPEQILSVTILNTPLINLPHFNKPFPMYFFEMKGIGELFLATTTPFLFQQLMHMRGIHQNKTFGIAEAKAYVKFLNGDNKGRTFLKIMRNFEPTQEKEDLYIGTLNQLEVPKQIVWGMNDRGLKLEAYALPLQKALGLERISKTPGSHFLQEDYAERVAEMILEQAKD